ncbi:probable ATP-dependent RNA helicase DHX34 [Macrosteles quadrilineatus]|uniref:probable ATP-dependent RNA helicase DHX34 n=1 Tax=Macrosteles quadrilineatus TaxID=74068 RepID=UPI0023E1D8BD|nr:probable ATP-dependent RNA helicase DHX34 [Macrosteles quadrilineatus]XP_054287251.1 probable ATP-dependent RNA helicase DHX34 [Macrosteles quadrilineatus]
MERRKSNHKKRRRSRSLTPSSDEISRPNRRKHERDDFLYSKNHHLDTPKARKVPTKPSRSRPLDFSFHKYKYELNKVFCRDSDLVQDIDDFWLFVEKYENIKKRAAEKQRGGPAQSSVEKSNFDKSSLINLVLTTKVEELEGRLPPHHDDPLTKQDLLDFRTILLSYLDFKQKEKFNKLRKLRETQANLPVFNHKQEIVEAAAQERVVIVAGDTGCGKSTQVPQYLMEAGYKRIACTQPRRIACISLCKRVAFETLSEYKSKVGYQIRFERSRNQETRIVFITEGLLLRQAAGEGHLSEYDVLVLDEVHERHLHGDFLLGVVKCLLLQRPTLKVILMSATINIKLFSDYFGDNTRVIQVPGRLHPIKLHYRPIIVEERASKSERLNPGPYVQIMQLIDEKYPKDERGDLLIFLPGMSEITAVVDAAKQYNEKTQGWIILPLHSTLSISDQDKVFDYAPEGIRKCIVSTNIAETSVTIDGVRFVVDSGKVKEMSYDAVCKMQRLKEFWISKASAEQRKGRAGRTGPGVCYRLYSEEDYAAMSAYTTPEIQRVPLDSLLLQMISMGLPDARKFPFIEPPPTDTIETAILSLKQHGALTSEEKLTTVGQLLSALPVDIPLGKMLIMGSLFHQVEPVLSLAAVLSVQTPFTHRAYRDIDCQTLRKQLESDHGDPITLLNVFREWLEVKRGERAASRSWCRKRGLEEQRFYEATKLRAQFKDLLQDCGLLKASERPSASLSSAERTLRHGEVKLLKSLKRSIQDAAPRTRRTLKPDSWTIAEDEDKAAVDLRDIDFRLRNNNSQIQDLLQGSSACSYKDLAMLKLILTSGFYPQLAVADEFNHCKTVSEQLFHCQTKPFVSLHPLSMFGNNSSVLQLEDGDIVPGPGKHPLSHRHQLLCYMSLLETTKAFLVNTLRMPAVQTLLIFCHDLYTNIDLTRVVCDNWLEVRFPVPDVAQALVKRVVRARTHWDNLLNMRFKDEDCGSLEKELTEDLVHLMNSQVVYSMRRLLAADLKQLFVGVGHNTASGSNPLSPGEEVTNHPKLGGVVLTPYLTYNCLVDDFTLETWTCDKCELTAALSFLEKEQHLMECQPTTQSSENKEVEEFSAPKPNSIPYNCPECDRTLHLTPVEVLKHKRSHVKS